QSTAHVPAVILPGDGRALSTPPHHLLVAAQPDVSAETLLVASGISRSDPTGLIACPPPCNVRFAPAYSPYRPASTQFAASWESAGDNFDLILQYEFENQILFTLGYDLRWR